MIYSIITTKFQHNVKLIFPVLNEGNSPVFLAMQDPHLVPSLKHANKIRKEIKFLEALPLNESLRVRRAVKLEAMGKQDLYELRIFAPSNMAYRLLFAIRYVGYIALHFFLKKSDNYEREIYIALNRLEQYDYERSKISNN